MTPQEIARYNNLMKRKEQLANFIYVYKGCKIYLRKQ